MQGDIFGDAVQITLSINRNWAHQSKAIAINAAEPSRLSQKSRFEPRT